MTAIWGQERKPGSRFQILTQSDLDAEKDAKLTNHDIQEPSGHRAIGSTFDPGPQLSGQVRFAPNGTEHDQIQTKLDAV